MSWIEAGSVVQFSTHHQDITVGKRYVACIDEDGRPFITDDAYDPMHSWVASPATLAEAGGRIIFRADGSYVPPEPDLPKDTRTALIEALKARAEAVKDAPLNTLEALEQLWIGQVLAKAYSIKAEVVPGPSTVTFTELANNP